MIFSIGAFIISTSSCKEDCDVSNVTYTNSIKSILDSNCTTSGCHSDNDLLTNGSLTNYTFAKAFADFGRLVGAVNHDAGFTAMPQGGEKLDQCDIDKIAAWVAAGAPE